MDKIAIIGLSCLFPGAIDPEQYWQSLIENKDLKSVVTAEEIGVDPNIFYDPTKGKTDKYYSLQGSYIRDFQFDPTGYNISPDFLNNLDKIYQWSLYVAKQALQDSGYSENKSILAKCGVILGNLSFPTRKSYQLFAPIYQKILNKGLGELLQQDNFQLPNLNSSGEISPLNAAIPSYPAALIAQALALSGIHFSLDAACASSLYAVKLACDYLLSGKADMMLAGAVSCADPFFINMGFSIFQAFPSDGISRPLNKSSEGLVAGEGASIVVLKRYSDAVRDGDRIYATICGIGLSNDGRGKFVLSPNSKGQILAFERAYDRAGINPNTIDYIECHATGTSLGDITEIDSMKAFFGKYKASPLIGSAKSNYGHLLTVAGMVGLVKVILSMNKGIIPATINISEPLSSDIVTTNTPWSHQNPIRRTAISAFGFGGTNAHLILESSNSDRIGKEAEISEPIQNSNLAIVGMEACFGSCDGLDAFDRTIYEAKQHFIPLPPQRWQGIEEYPQLLLDYGLQNGTAPVGAYIKEFEMDFLRCKIPLLESDKLIPQQLLMLKVADGAIKDAKLKEGGNVAVIIAMDAELALHQFRARCDLSWQIRESLAQANINLPPEKIAELENIAKNSLHQPANINQYTSYIGNIMACRISSLWDFTGPAFTISASENSVFKALEVAQLFLASGEVEAVVVGAVDLAGGFEHILLRNQMFPLNQGVNTLSFDCNTNGWAIGEGAGAVVLKLHDLAKKDQNRIYAVIDAINCVQQPASSQSTALEVPDAETIKQNCLSALKLAGVKPTEIGYLEVHGSGIAESDTVEIKGLNLVYQALQQPNSCCIGSVKANIGHTYAASGIASLIKTALCIYHRYIPATPNWVSPKMSELWEESCFYVASESRTWFLEPGATKRIAAINGIGLDRSCCHLILSEELSQQERTSKYLQQTPFYLFPLASDSQSSLESRLNTLATAIENSDNLQAIASQTFNVFQKHPQVNYTIVIIGRNREELLREINLAIADIKSVFAKVGEWQTPLGSYFTANPLGKRGKVAFVYPGMGSSDLGVGRDIFRLFPQISEKFSTITKHVGEVLHEKLIYPRSLEKLSKAAEKEKQAQFFDDGVAMCQSGISFAVLYTLIIKEYFRVQPQIAFGYSLGEASSMMFSLGVWRDDNNLSRTLSLSPVFKTELCGECSEVYKFFNLPPTSKPNILTREGGFRVCSRDFQSPGYGYETYEPCELRELWSSYIFKTPIDAIKKAIAQEKYVYITFINTPNEVVICGETKACLRIINTLKCINFPIYFNSALHCEVAQSKYEELVKLHAIPVHNVPDIKFYSGVNFAPISLDSATLAENAAKLVCQTIDFPRIVNSVYNDGAKIFIELGTRNKCSQWIGEILKGREHIAMSINSKGVDDYTAIIRILAKLVSHQVPVDLSPLYTATLSDISQSRSLIKKVTLGGDRILTKMLAQTNKNIFTQNTMTKNNIDWQETMKIIQLQIGVSEQLVNQKLEILNNTQTKTAVDTVWNEADLLEFASGKISRVFGKEYEIVDNYPRRVRLPMPPYLLVSRVTKIEGEIGRFKPSSITTEYDIPHNAWYSVDGQIPWAVAVESGQCDLLLISYLGIDFENKGNLVYRLLDCSLTFLDDLPKEGNTLRYDIKINSFVRQGDNLLFFFSYDCYVGDKKILIMQGGCAGFFSDEQLSQGKGIIFTEKEIAERSQIKPSYFEPLLICQKSAFDESDLLSLTEGEIAACFGDHYWQDNLNPSLRLTPKSILMIDKITSVEPTGGVWGLGLIIAEKTLDPEDWYFPCHFKDDQVLAGSLMAEGCCQILQFYLLYLGLQICTTDARFQPISGLRQVVRCRGQVTPTSAKLIYRMEVSEIGLTPHPYAKCNVEVILNGKIIVHFKDLGLQLSEKKSKSLIIEQHQPEVKQHLEKFSQKAALLNREQITEFCLGSVAKCFGPEFAIYDSGIVKSSRMPNTHLNLVHRALSIQGERHRLTKDTTIVTEYDTPIDPWYYRQNSSETIPYSILMEMSLQPCGLLSAYLGTTLIYPNQDLYFRNLDGKGHLSKNIDIRGKTITNIVKLLSSSNIEGAIIQSYDFKIICDGEVFYQGDATFGHFSSKALANQVGLDRGQYVKPWYEVEDIIKLPEVNIDLRTPENRTKFYLLKPNQPNYRLGCHQLDLLNEVRIIEGGGRYHQGYIFAMKKVKPSDWYFKCHFFQDPVMPGSLGVEAILQAIQVYAMHFNLGKHFKSPRFIHAENHTTIWKYRGQIPHGTTDVYLEVHISKVDITPERVTLVADASLWKQKLRIYEIRDVAVCLVDAAGSRLTLS